MAVKSQTSSKPGTKKSSKKPKSARKVTKPASTVGKGLVIVESPAKARTVGQILGRKYVVVASQGHMRDLPKSSKGRQVLPAPFCLPGLFRLWPLSSFEELLCNRSGEKKRALLVKDPVVRLPCLISMRQDISRG